jgi:hypothetical protein
VYLGSSSRKKDTPLSLLCFTRELEYAYLVNKDETAVGGAKGLAIRFAAGNPDQGIDINLKVRVLY